MLSRHSCIPGTPWLFTGMCWWRGLAAVVLDWWDGCRAECRSPGEREDKDFNG